VYVHCWGGKGRTATVIGCHLIDGGLDYDATLAELRRLRAGTKKAGEAVLETAAQHEVLRDRAVRLRDSDAWTPRSVTAHPTRSRECR
jgi:protein-tyrosine phosphatase